MNELNARFLEFFNYLISQNIVKSAKEFAEIIEVSSSLISEIVKGRTIVGSKVIQNSVIKFNLNANWLFIDNVPMLRDGAPGQTQVIEEKKEIYADSAAFSSLINEIKALSGENALLKKENEDLRQKLESKNNYKPLDIAAEPGVKYLKK